MKTMVLTALGGLAAASLLAAPALAQPYGGPPPGAHPGYGPPPAGVQPYGGPPPGARTGYGAQPGGWEINRRVRWLQERISRGRADGSLDRREFRRVQSELNRIRRGDEDARAANGGHLPGPVRADLQGRLDRLSDQIHWLRASDVRRPW